jgi:dUTP pyrophosphatase
MPIPVFFDPKNKNLPFPEYKSEGASGFDICADLGEYPKLTLFPGETRIISTGLYVALPEGYELQIRTRSGMAAKHQIVITNSPGTIDSDYRGEVSLIITNHGREPFVVESGARLAQGVICPVIRGVLIPVESLDGLGSTVRGSGGFGSTGIKG